MVEINRVVSILYPSREWGVAMAAANRAKEAVSKLRKMSDLDRRKIENLVKGKPVRAEVQEKEKEVDKGKKHDKGSGKVKRQRHTKDKRTGRAGRSNRLRVAEEADRSSP